MEAGDCGKVVWMALLEGLVGHVDTRTLDVRCNQR